MGTIVLFALAAAVYPQLLAVVVVMLTRPNPQRLLWACFLGSLLVAIGSSVAILAVFRSRGSIVEATSHRLGPGTYLVIGTIALLLAIVLATSRGRLLVERSGAVRGRRAGAGSTRSKSTARMRARGQKALQEGSVLVAAAVGALLAIPGPFDLLALGRLARGPYSAVVAAAVMAGFAAIKFMLIEIPIAGYAIDPDGTGARVGRFSAWMHANKLIAMAAVVALVAILLIGRGISILR
jgi:hypothetical protein